MRKNGAFQAHTTQNSRFSPFVPATGHNVLLFRMTLKYPFRPENFGLNIRLCHRPCPIVQIRNVEKPFPRTVFLKHIDQGLLIA